MTDEHPLAVSPAGVDLILRTRLGIHVDRLRGEGLSLEEIAGRMGLSASGLRRRLCTRVVDEHGRRELRASVVDEMLTGLGLDPCDVLEPVMAPRWRHILQDVALIEGIGSGCLMSKLDNEKRHHAQLHHDQGLLTIHGDRDDERTWYLRLTRSGRRALLALDR